MDRLYPFSILPILFFIAISFTGLSSTIKGNISDSKTGEPLTGAIVYLKNTKYSSVAGLDGSYLIQDVPPGSYEIFSQLVGYATFEKNIVLPGDQSFSLNIPLVENQTELSEVVITGTIDKE